MSDAAGRLGAAGLDTGVAAVAFIQESARSVVTAGQSLSTDMWSGVELVSYRAVKREGRLVGDAADSVAVFLCSSPGLRAWPMSGTDRKHIVDANSILGIRKSTKTSKH